MGERVHIAVVNRLFGLHVISKKTTSQPVQTLVVAPHQSGKGGRISCPHAGEQLAVGHALLRSLGRPNVHPRLLLRSSS